MSFRRRVAFVFIVVVVASVLPPGTPPAMAFTEGPSNNFFGTGAGDDPGNIGTGNSFFGGSAGTSNTTGSFNSFFGQNAGATNTEGVGNAFFGLSAGFSSTTGLSNSFYGQEAGFSNTASQNSFFGALAGRSNTSGASNAFFGVDAGRNNTTGASNSFFGRAAGFNNTASDNAFYGHDAGASNTTGASNAFFGRFAGFSNTTACCNVFVGAGAGRANNTGSSNAFFGRDAGRLNTAGRDNAFFGRDAGQSNTTGLENGFFGHVAGQSNTTGSHNLFLGRATGFSNTTGHSNAFVGNDAGFSNTTACCNAFFGRSAGAFNTTGLGNAFFGSSAAFSNTTGSHNAFFGRDAGASNTTEDANSFFGASSDGVAGITNATAVGHRAQVYQSHSLVLGSIAGENGATQNVRVGIGTPTPADPLHVRRTDGTAKVLVEEASGTLLGRELFQLSNNGAARFRVSNTSNGATWDFQSSSGGGSFVIDRVGGPVSLDFELQPDGDAVFRGTATATTFITSSDRNLKTDITPADATKLMAMLRRLEISTWRFRNEPEGTVNLGPMAQDFHSLFGMGTDTTVQIRDLAALALVAAKSLDEQVQSQEKDADAKDVRIVALQDELTELRSDMAGLERIVAEIAAQR